MRLIRVEAQEFRSRKTVSTPVQAACPEQKKTLYRIALIITGNSDLAEQYIVDAGSLNPTGSHNFRAWLAEWGQIATARAAVNAVRSQIHATAARYSDWTCSHRKHEALPQSGIERLQEVPAHRVIDQLDVLGRAVLMLHGYLGVSLEQCVDVLNVPLQSVVGAYCKALECLSELTQSAGQVRNGTVPKLRLVRHDPDGVPVWGSECAAG
jgi:DNA-directed RNA polymerase specialized sigma24 family protein